MSVALQNGVWGEVPIVKKEGKMNLNKYGEISPKDLARCNLGGRSSYRPVKKKALVMGGFSLLPCLCSALFLLLLLK